MASSTSADNVGVASAQYSQTAAPNKTTTHYLENGPSYELEMDNSVKPGINLPPILCDLTPEALAEMEKKLVRKVDLRLLPMLVLMYIMNVRCPKPILPSLVVSAVTYPHRAKVLKSPWESVAGILHILIVQCSIACYVE